MNHTTKQKLEKKEATHAFAFHEQKHIHRQTQPSNYPLLQQFNQTHFAIDQVQEKGNTAGKPTHIHTTFNPISNLHIHPITIFQAVGPQLEWQQNLPTKLELYRHKFGQPTKHLSFTQEACGETILHFVLKSGFLTHDETNQVHETHPLVRHLDVMRHQLTNYDFRWIRDIDENWNAQLHIKKEKSRAMMACLMHYDNDVSLLMRYLGNNYTAAHRRVQDTATILRTHNVEEWLVQQYIRVMTVGCPAKMVAETTRENAMKYFRGGNNPSINRKLDQVMQTMNKEEKNNFVIALPCWLWRFLPHLFFTPQHILEKVGKKDRQIFDAAYRHDADSIPLNSMTSTAEGVELDCGFGTVFTRLLQRIWNLRISYPSRDIITHANDVKSCFRQLKHHPDVMGAFSYIMGDYLFLQCALTFGSDFSPASWEVVRRIAEILSESLFSDASLRQKHHQYLQQLQWKRGLGSTDIPFSPAKKDSINTGVLDEKGNPINTPHAYYVDDDVYSEVYDIARIEQAVASSIEAIFILLGRSDLRRRQDPVSFDKMIETLINWKNLILGRVINTRTMMVSTPVQYVRDTVSLIENKWHRKRRRFIISDLEELTGRLGHISETVPWLRFLMAHLYASSAHALGLAKAHLINTRKEFRNMLKLLKQERFNQDADTSDATETDTSKEERHKSYYLSVTAKMVHKSRLPIDFNATLRLELSLIKRGLSSDKIALERPIAHMIPTDPSGIGHSDSCLLAAGGFSIEMRFWWYIEWDERIRARTLKYIKNNKNDTLISINVLEYAALIINYMAATHFFRTNPSKSDPYPTVLLYADNTTAEAWGKMKSCKSSMTGRTLGRLQCALMMNNNVGINIAHVTTKDNEIADRISRIKKETNVIPNFSQLVQDFPQLKSCRRFHPPQDLVSAITAILLRERSFDPLEAGDKVLSTLG